MKERVKKRAREGEILMMLEKSQNLFLASFNDFEALVRMFSKNNSLLNNFHNETERLEAELKSS